MSGLPKPGSAAAAHGVAVVKAIADVIQHQGPIPFSEFMRLALYAPGLGYYSAGATKLGVAGDFVTAPELSPQFSYCLARQAVEVLQQLGGGDILEFGAGSGVMATDLLLECQRLNCLPEHYYIVEVSADLRERQQQQLRRRVPNLIKRVQWLQALPEQPIRGVIVANEVLDAMPVEIFKQAEGLKQFFVDYQDQQFRWQLKAIEDLVLGQVIDGLGISFAEGYQSEVNLHLQGWLQALSDCLRHGAIILVDYGFPRHEYYHPDRDMGTLMCHYQHQAHPDPLVYPGLQDISAHVDFTAVAEAATIAGFEVVGFTNQAAFLINCGIELNDPTHAQALKQLLMPSEMGELFKVIALSKGQLSSMMGFAKACQLHRL